MTRSPPVTTAPSARAAESAACMASKLAPSISGPTRVPASSGCPIEARVGFLQAVDERLSHVLVDDEAARGRAALAAGADRCEGDAAHRQVQICGRRDDHGVV